MKVNPRENQEMFDSIADGYDITNDFMTLYRHKSWYRKIVKLANLQDGDKVLDCATGTGNVAIEFSKYYGSKIDITGIDVALKMLEFARKKNSALNYNINFVEGNLNNLNFPDDSFNAVSISFGIRNVPDTKLGIIEMTRVVKPQKKLLILETGTPSFGIFKFIYRIYQAIFVKLFGVIFTKNKNAYDFFVNSTNEFPSGHKFTQIMLDTDLFSKVSFKSMMFGTIYLYIGIKK